MYHFKHNYSFKFVEQQLLRVRIPEKKPVAHESPNAHECIGVSVEEHSAISKPVVRRAHRHDRVRVVTGLVSDERHDRRGKGADEVLRGKCTQAFRVELGVTGAGSDTLFYVYGLGCDWGVYDERVGAATSAHETIEPIIHWDCAGFEHTALGTHVEHWQCEPSTEQHMRAAHCHVGSIQVESCTPSNRFISRHSLAMRSAERFY